MRTRFCIAVVAVAFSTALPAADAADAAAVSRADAKRAALRMAGLAQHRGVIAAHVKALRRGAVVKEAGAPRSALRVRRPAFVVWLDLMPGFGYEHPSVLAVVDRRSGRVVVKRAVVRWPVRRSGAPLFPSRSTPPRPRRRARQAQGAAGGPCFVVAGSTSTLFAGSTGLARELAGATRGQLFTAASASELETAVRSAQSAGCAEVAIILIGHGSPVVQSRPFGDGTWGSADPVVSLELEVPGRPDLVRDVRITATEVRTILDAANRRDAGTRFSVVVEACFSGRWPAALLAMPNVAFAGSSAGSNQLAPQNLPSGLYLSGIQVGPGGASPYTFVPGPPVAVVNPRGASGFIASLRDDLPGALVATGDLARAMARAISSPTNNFSRAFGGAIPVARLKTSATVLPGGRPGTGAPPGPFTVDISLHGESNRPDRRWATGKVIVSWPGGRKECPFGRTSIDRCQSGSIPAGSDVTIEAVPDPGSRFDHWARGCSGTGTTCVLTNLRDHAHVEAYFTRVEA